MTKANILIVEDEAIVAADIKNRLKAFGYLVPAVVSSGEQAVQKVEKHRPDLVLMDIVLKGEMDGIDAADIIRSRFGTPVIFLTAYADEERLKRAKLIMPFGYILKPFQDRDLKVAIEMALYACKVDAQRKQAEEALWESEKKYRHLVESILDWVWSIDIEGRITFTNEAVKHILGYEVHELLGSSSFYIMHPEDQELSQRLFQQVVKQKRGWKNAVVRMIHKDGSVRFFESSAQPIIDAEGRLFGFTGIDRNITERKRAEEALRKSQTELRNLASHLQEISENERKAIAREIHDEVGQAMTALKMDMSSLADSVGDNMIMLNKIGSMAALINSTLSVVRRLQTELRPHMIDDLGLGETIRWQLSEFEKRSKVFCSIDISADIDSLGEKPSITLFRVMQEALTNIARHAEAENVHVAIREENGKIAMEIKDDGKGMDPEKIRNSRSFGILSMRERVTALGGSLEISGEPGKGTVVTAKIPGNGGE